MTSSLMKFRTSTSSSVVEDFSTHLESVGTQVAAACSLAKLARGPKTAWAF